MVEGARLESEYTSKAYRGFESLPLRHNLLKIRYYFPVLSSMPTSDGHFMTRMAHFGHAFGGFTPPVPCDPMSHRFITRRRRSPDDGAYAISGP